MMSAEITLSSTVKEVAEFLERKGLGEIKDKPAKR